jgi:hypothetical protein
MKKALVAAVGSLLFTMPALADEPPAAPASIEPAAVAAAPVTTGEAARSTTSERTDKAAARDSRPAPSRGAANAGEASQVKQVPLKALNDGTVCRTEYPTGSRIGVKRCSSRSETAGDKIQNEIMRRDIEEMRDRQLYEQVQRASIGMTPTMPSAPSR